MLSSLNFIIRLPVKGYQFQFDLFIKIFCVILPKLYLHIGINSLFLIKCNFTILLKIFSFLSIKYLEILILGHVHQFLQ